MILGLSWNHFFGGMTNANVDDCLCWWCDFQLNGTKRSEKCYVRRNGRVLLFPDDVKYKDSFREKYSTRDLVVVMGPVGAITAGKFRDYKEQVDAVLVAPQVKYMYKTVEEVLGELNIPCANINSLDFGRMRGDKILTQGLALMNAKNSK